MMTERKFLGNATFAGDVDFTGTVTGVRSSGGGVEIGDIIETHPDEPQRVGYLDLTETQTLLQTGDTAELPQTTRDLLLSRYPVSPAFTGAPTVEDFEVLPPLIDSNSTTYPLGILSDLNGNYGAVDNIGSTYNLYHSDDLQSWTFNGTTGTLGPNGGAVSLGSGFLIATNSTSGNPYGGSNGYDGALVNTTAYRSSKALYQDESYAFLAYDQSTASNNNAVKVFKLGVNDLPDNGVTISTPAGFAFHDGIYASHVSKSPSGVYYISVAGYIYATSTPEIEASWTLVGDPDVEGWFKSSVVRAFWVGDGLYVLTFSNSSYGVYKNIDPGTASWVSLGNFVIPSVFSLFGGNVYEVTDGVVYINTSGQFTYISLPDATVHNVDLSSIVNSPDGTRIGSLRFCARFGNEIFVGGYTRTDGNAQRSLIARLKIYDYNPDTEFQIKGVGLIDGMKRQMRVA